MESKDFIKKVFHESETKNYSAEHLAGIFAAKEAFFKALGTNPKWLDIEVKKQNGKPIINLCNGLKETIQETDVSISHEKEYAIAAVILTTNDG